jgi:nickel/cobalt transporter (NicO) family protein
MHLSMIEATTREVLLGTAASVALLHTLIGVDHYLPFVVLGRARNWSMRKVAGLTALCGLGHVIGSILLGVIGIGLGTAVGELEAVESVRGELAAWGLIAFGLAYTTWSVVRLRRGKTHSHAHVHADGSTHDHEHGHEKEHLHAHNAGGSISFWSLFIVFALGPCEPLIPVLMAPAFAHDWWLVAEVTGLFAAVTIGCMVTMAVLGAKGLSFARFDGVERYTGVLAGGAIASSGLAIQFLGI